MRESSICKIIATFFVLVAAIALLPSFSIAELSKLDRELLYTAYFTDDARKMESLVKKGANVSVTDERGRTALHRAAMKGNVRIVDLLVIRTYFDINVLVDNDGKTPLHLAAENGKLDVVVKLLRLPDSIYRDFCLNSYDKNDMTPIELADKNGHKEIVEYLISAGANTILDNRLIKASKLTDIRVIEDLIRQGANVDVLTSGGMTPLLLAINNVYPPSVKVLLEHGVDPNMKKFSNLGFKGPPWFPLSLAVQHGNFPIVKMLVEYGADINKKDPFGRTPYDFALQLNAGGSRQEIVDFLIAKGAIISSQNLLDDAIKSGNLVMARKLIKDGVNLNTIAYVGTSLPLKTALGTKNAQMIALLLESGADPNIKDFEGKSYILYDVVQYGDVETAKLLLAYHADVNAHAYYGQTPLHGAVDRGKADFIRLFVENGADVNAREEGGFTPLDIARFAEYEHGRHVDTKILLDRGAVYSDNGRLFISIYERNLTDMSNLLANDMNINIKYHGSAPIHIAAERGYISEAKLLLENHADIDIVGYNGWTPLERAVRQGKADMVRFLVENGADLKKLNLDNGGLDSLSDNKEIIDYLKAKIKESKAK